LFVFAAPCRADNTPRAFSEFSTLSGFAARAANARSGAGPGGGGEGAFSVATFAGCGSGRRIGWTELP
jgi:hypothetical protein